MTPRRSTLMRKKTKLTSTSTFSRKLKSNSSKLASKRCSSRCSSAPSKKKTRMMTMRKRYQALTIPTSMQTYQFRKK